MISLLLYLLLLDFTRIENIDEIYMTKRIVITFYINFSIQIVLILYKF